jgi:hypothetical protein
VVERRFGERSRRRRRRRGRKRGRRERMRKNRFDSWWWNLCQLMDDAGEK